MRLSFFQEVLLATASVLAAVLIAEMIFVMPGHVMAGATRLDEPPRGVALTEQPPSLGLPTREALRAFIERPLFEKSRRSRGVPYEWGKEGGSAADVTLIGTVVTLDESIAVLQVENGTDPVRAHVGEVVGGWRVVQIAPNGVLLSNNLAEEWVSTGAQN